MWANVINTVGSPCNCHMDVSFSTSFPSCNAKPRKTHSLELAQSTLHQRLNELGAWSSHCLLPHASLG